MTSVKVAPSSGAERTSSVPPCASAIERAMKRPSPVPGNALPDRARPNFSKMSVWSSDAMPGPRSRTFTTTFPLRAVAVTSTGSPEGEYLTAFSTRFAST
jgi:hypothetical protein